MNESHDDDDKKFIIEEARANRLTGLFYSTQEIESTILVLTGQLWWFVYYPRVKI